MADAFDVLGADHAEMKQLLAELEASGAVPDVSRIAYARTYTYRTLSVRER
jgi:hypothetical protein